MINVTKTYLPDINKYQRYVEQIFNSGWLTNNGELVQNLEKRLCDYLGVPYVVLISNGTLALQIAYKLLELKGEIITTPFTFVATTSSLVWEGLIPVFADIDSNTYNISPSDIEKKITSKSTAILPVHVFGNPCEIEKIEEISKQNNLKVIYDAAHAFGVNYKGKSIAQYGDLSVFSFHSTKIFHTIEGGAIIVRTKEQYDKAKLLINFGIPGPDRITALGINCKMNEFQAAMGLCVLDDLPGIIKSRKVVYERYLEGFHATSTLSLQTLSNYTANNFAYFPILFSSEDELLKKMELLMKQDILPRRYFYPSLEKLPYLKKQDVRNSDSISKRILCLPLFENLSWEIQKKIIDFVNKK